VAMSGGVDSSVAAALLREDGSDIVGVTLRLRECDDIEESRSCCGIDAIGRARAVAAELGIRHYILDVAREFEKSVLEPAWRAYARGRTPSPCLLCNERIKFGSLLDWATRLGAEALATGHYARVGGDATGSPHLLRGADSQKDQSYFLSGLTGAQLARARFPIGAMRKAEVRAKATALGLATRATRDSQDACLAGKGGFAEALRVRFGAEARAGEIVDEAGSVLGRHQGTHRFTVGQSRGLGAAVPRRVWVKELRASEARVVVTRDAASLEGAAFSATHVAWVAGTPPRSGRCEVQVRYRSIAVPAEVAPAGPGIVRVSLDAKIRAIAPGQAAVFYSGDGVLGRGWIDNAD